MTANMMKPAVRKRNSLSLSLQTEQSVFSPCFARPGSGEQSPMTVLSNTLGGLSCVSGDTPKRCLFNLDNTPLRDSPISRSASECSSDSGCVESPSPVDSAFTVVEQFKAVISGQSAFDRRSSATFVKPPVFSMMGRRKSLLRGGSLEDSKEQGAMRLRAATDSGIGLDKENQMESVSTMTTIDEPMSPSSCMMKEVSFHAKPMIIPPSSSSSLTATSLTFQQDRPTSAPATLFESRKRAQTMVDDSPVQLRHSRLTSSEEDNDDQDDGFSDIFDSDSNDAANAEVSGLFSAGLTGLMEAPILHKPSPKKSCQGLFTSPLSSALRDLDCNTMGDTPGPKCRRGIFKVPSQPAMRRRDSLLKRADRPQDEPSPIQNKRPRSCSIAVESPSLIRPKPMKAKRPILGRSLSANMLSSMRSPETSMCLGDMPSPDLIGDHSKPFCLPLCIGKNRNMKSISPETVCRLLNSEFDDEVGEYYIVDCRYPYEYEGGHIQGGLNKYTKDSIMEFFFKTPMAPLDKRRVIIFHCEFSSERGPKMLNFLRNTDRDLHAEHYPDLYYPELYILEGGYKAFYGNSKTFCVPKTYKPMDHKDHLHDLKHFKAKSKSWAGGERSRLKLHSRKLLPSSSQS